MLHPFLEPHIARKSKASSRVIAVVQGLKNTLQDADRTNNLMLSHRIPVVSPYSGASLVFTVEIVRGRKHLFVATCREFPGLLVSGSSEPEVLRKAETEIRHRLQAGGL